MTDNRPTQIEICRYVTIAEEILRYVGNRRESKDGERFYSTFTGVGDAKLKTMVFTISVTLGYHPYSLGMLPETKGMVFVGDDIQLKAQTVQNILAERRRGRNGNAINK